MEWSVHQIVSADQSYRRRFSAVAAACVGITILLTFGARGVAVEPIGQVGSAEKPAPFPLDELLVYDVRYLGLHCGTMTLESFVEESDDGELCRIQMNARSSKFFDGIYKVRTRIDSWFSAERMASVRYHSHGQEKKRITDDLYEVDLAGREVRRTKNGESSSFPIANEHIHDPLAYIYRLRMLVGEPGDAITLALVTSKGDLETVAEVTRRKRIKTRFGRREALLVVPQPKDGMLFSKSGRMEVWYGVDDRRLPYRVVFDLSFGKLVAKLKETHARTPASD
jgi:hypothetical protein